MKKLLTILLILLSGSFLYAKERPMTIEKITQTVDDYCNLLQELLDIQLPNIDDPELNASLASMYPKVTEEDSKKIRLAVKKQFIRDVFCSKDTFTYLGDVILLLGQDGNKNFYYTRNIYDTGLKLSKKLLDTLDTFYRQGDFKSIVYATEYNITEKIRNKEVLNNYFLLFLLHDLEEILSDIKIKNDKSYYEYGISYINENDDFIIKSYLIFLE